MLEELRTPLEKVWTDEFNRYVELFYKYLPKRPFHHRFRYGDGFLCAKGKYKGRDVKYDRTCCPALIAKHLDYWRWQNCRPEKACSPNYWIAMFPGKKSALKTIDFDNKQNLLGYYLDVADNPRPLPTLPLKHLQTIKRLYDAFPGRIWCVRLGDPRTAPLATDAISAICRGHPSRRSTKASGDWVGWHRDPPHVRQVFSTAIRTGLLHHYR